MQPCPDLRRFILSHVEHAVGRLGFRADAPPGHECDGRRRVGEVLVDLVPASRHHPDLFAPANTYGPSKAMPRFTGCQRDGSFDERLSKGYQVTN